MCVATEKAEKQEAKLTMKLEEIFPCSQNLT